MEALMGQIGRLKGLASNSYRLILSNIFKAFGPASRSILQNDVEKGVDKKLETSFRIKLFLVLFGLTVGLGAAEIALHFLKENKEGSEFEDLGDLRAAMKSPTHRKDGQLTLLDVINESPNEKIIYELRPNLNVTFTGAPVTTNSLGLRGRETTLEKPNNTYRIALLGDSFAFGWGVKNEETFAQVIEQQLNSKSNNSKHFEVLNFGVPGYSTFQEVEAFKQKGLKFKPDMTLVFFVHNDFDYPFFVRDISKNKNESGSALVRLTGRVLDPHKVQHQMEQQGIDPNTSLAELDDICRENKIELLFTINPRKEWAEYLDRLKVLKARPSIAYIDIAKPFEAIVEKNNYTQNDLNLADDPHPSILRHKIYGELLADEISRKIL